MKNAAEILDLGTRLPRQDEIDNAAQASSAIAEAHQHDGSLIIGGCSPHSITLSPAVAELIVDLLSHIANGKMVTLVPTGAMLTTQKAADLLNVSRPYLSSLLKQGKIPHVLVGSHRRVRLEDLMAYKAQRDVHRKIALMELMQLGQEFDTP